MFNYSDFTDTQTKSSATVELPYDFFEHVVQQNKRDDESRIEYRAPEKMLRAISRSETCERCGKDLNARVYVWNRKRLCKSCLEEGQGTWMLYSKGSNAARQRVSVQPLIKANERSLIDSLISEFLAVFGLKRIEPSVPDPKLPIKRARLQTVQRPDRKQMPESEGIMKGKKSYYPRKSDK